MFVVRIERMVVVVLCLLPLLTQAVADEKPRGSAISDIQLGENGTLHGQIVDRQGQSQADSRVALLQGDTEIANATTDADGNFTIAHLNTGVYHLEAAGQTSAHRLWAPQLAPPKAHRGVLVVSGPPAIRGRLGSRLGGLGRWARVAAFAASGYYVVDKYILDDKEPAS